jgi:hypothetical protein
VLRLRLLRGTTPFVKEPSSAAPSGTAHALRSLSDLQRSQRAAALAVCGGHARTERALTGAARKLKAACREAEEPQALWRSSSASGEDERKWLQLTGLVT